MEPAGGEGRDTSGVEYATHSAGCGQRQAVSLLLLLLVLGASAVTVWQAPVPPIGVPALLGTAAKPGTKM